MHKLERMRLYPVREDWAWNWDLRTGEEYKLMTVGKRQGFIIINLRVCMYGRMCVDIQPPSHPFTDLPPPILPSFLPFFEPIFRPLRASAYVTFISFSFFEYLYSSVVL